MKNTKRILALLLVLCTLASFVVPTVVVADEQASVEEQTAPETVVYDFSRPENNGDVITNHTAAIKEAYDAGQQNWRFEAASNVYQYRVNGKHEGVSSNGVNRFVSDYMQLSSGAQWWHAFRIKAPGAGNYDMTLANKAYTSGAENSLVYMLKASQVDALLGENAASYAETFSADPYLAGSTAAFTALKSAVESLMSEATLVANPDFKTGTAASWTYRFEAEEEYILVVKMGEGSNGVRLTTLTAAYSADQSEPEDTEPSLTVNFQNDATATELNSTTSFSTTSTLQKLNAAYEAGSIQWVPYLGADGKLIQNNAHSSGTRIRWNSALTKSVFEMKSENAGPTYVALKFKAPGTGNYKLSVNYTWLSKGDLDAEEAGAYILDMPATAYTGATLAATEASGKAKVTFTPGTMGTYNSGEETAYLESGKEYIIVFYAKHATEAGTITDFSDFSLIFVNSDKPETIESLAVNFQTDVTAADVNATANFNDASLITRLNAAYEAGTIQWAPYTDENGKPILQNANSSGTRIRWNSALTKAVLEIKNNNIGTVYVALKFRAPGTGNYKLSVNYTWLSKGDLDAEEAGAYVLNMPETAYTASTLSKTPGDAKITFTPGTMGAYDSGDDTVYLESGKEYIVVFYATHANQAGTNTDFSDFALTYMNSDEPQPPEDTEPNVPEGPGYTDGYYNFYHGVLAGDSLDVGIENIAAMYEADTLNWKYEALYGIDLAKSSYSGKTNSMLVPAVANRWLAFRIKSPAQDGAYDIQMTHGAGGNGATDGSIFVIPGDTAEKDIAKMIVRTGAVAKTDWFYGENKSDTIGGRVSETGNVSLRANTEYIVVFQPTEKSNLSGNSYFWLGQLQLTRTGDFVESETPEVDKDAVVYEFYDWENPGQYLYHYKTEEQVGKKILAEEVAQKYADGELNWCYLKSNGVALYSTSVPSLTVTLRETHYFVLKIKSPGTGTYEITYDYYAFKGTKAAPKSTVYIVPADEGTEYAAVKEAANFADAVFSNSCQAEKTTLQQSKGQYTAFQEGKEYYLCFSVEDTDYSKSVDLSLQPVAMTMKRIGEYAPIASGGYDDGIVYQLRQEKYAGKWLSVREGSVTDDVAAEYAAGTLNWKYEAMSGGAKFYKGYLGAGVGKAGSLFAIRIKSPGTGMYKVTLKHMLGFEPTAATFGKMYIIEAPEKTLSHAELVDSMVKAPILEFTSTYQGTRFKKVSESGTYGFLEGKEYIVMFRGTDTNDAANTKSSCDMYLDRLVMKRIGDYVAPEKGINQGGIVAKEVVKEFQHGGVLMTTMNDHDYLVFGSYGGTLLIYDLDEWRLIDEVEVGLSGVGTPRTIAQDQDGRWWVAGTGQSMYCYDPYTRTGFNTGKIHSGSNVFEVFAADDGYLYFGVPQSKGVYIHKFDPRTLTNISWQPETWATYIGATKVIGDYIYTAATGNDHHEIWKMDKNTGKILDRVDISKNFNPGMRYVNGMSILNDEYLLVHSDFGITIVDINKMEMLSDEEHGLSGKANRGASGVLDGKQYFVTSLDGLCYYDTETKTFGKVGGELANFKTGLRGPSCIATIEDSRLAEKSIITWAGMTADGLNLYAINLETKSSVTLIGLIEPAFGSGKESHTIFNGAPGSGEIIFTAMYPQYPARIYNTQTKEIAREIMTKGQNDSYCYYNGYMYFGNYTAAMLTRMDGNQATALFQLHDENFNQSRIHSICGGDNKIFAGTIPYNFNYGGVIAWYDLETELTYVVTGPNPEDVYYAKCSTVTVTNEWYSAVTHELVDMKKEWDKDQDGDGVCQYFKGPIPMQSIIKVEYANGLLYGFSSLRPGSGAAELTGQGMTSQIFIYDVDNMKMLKTLDLADYIDGLPREIRVIEGLTADPDIANKLWGVVGETLFSMTHDKDTGKVTIKEELSFNKDNFDAGGSIPQDIVFDGEYMYVLFDAMGGLCRVNRNNPKDYKQLLWDFDKVSQVPTHFVLGEDGDIYYITGNTNLYVLNLDVTEEELAQAKAVQDAIDLIPENITIADREIIFAARAAWDAMDPANQPFVDNFAELEEAEVQLLQLRIDELGEITIEDEAELMSIRQTYIAMDPALRMRVDFQKVSDAESIMSILRGERTSALIDALGEITLDDEAAVRVARASYMALTRYERTLVANIETLNAAESALTLLLLSKNEAAAVDKKIDEIGFVFFGNGKIKAAKEAYDKLSDSAKEMVTKYNTLKTAQIILIAEYVVAVLLVAGGAYITVTGIRKKKVKAE